MKRRAFGLGLACLGLAPGVQAAPKPLASAELELSELELPGHKDFGRALLCVPRVLPERPGLLVLLHGLGETYDQRVGSRAFAERYGLLTAVSRLQHPPLARTQAGQDYFGRGRLEELNRALGERPFAGQVLLCPFTPNPYKAGGEGLIERYARFVSGPLLSEVERRTGLVFPERRSMISGVSLGGYLALELFLRSPARFCGVGSAQGAFGQGQAERYAAGLAAAVKANGQKAIALLTSSFDPYRAPNELLKRKLEQRGVPASLLVSPGPHDQRWLRESGTIEMLIAAQRAFSAAERSGS